MPRPDKKKKQPVDASEKRSPDDVDKYVGKRVRMRRSLLRLSQTRLAKAVNVTFQQVQKYEQGTNRISAGRLYQFSQVLGVPVSFFFEGIDGDRKVYGLADNKQEGFQSEATMDSRESHEVLKAYYSLKDKKKRRELLKIIKTMAENWAE